MSTRAIQAATSELWECVRVIEQWSIGAQSPLDHITVRVGGVAHHWWMSGSADHIREANMFNKDTLAKLIWPTSVHMRRAFHQLVYQVCLDTLPDMMIDCAPFRPADKVRAVAQFKTFVATTLPVLRRAVWTAIIGKLADYNALLGSHEAALKRQRDALTTNLTTVHAKRRKLTDVIATLEYENPARRLSSLRDV